MHKEKKMKKILLSFATKLSWKTSYEMEGEFMPKKIMTNASHRLCFSRINSRPDIWARTVVALAQL